MSRIYRMNHSKECRDERVENLVVVVFGFICCLKFNCTNIWIPILNFRKPKPLLKVIKKKNPTEVGFFFLNLICFCNGVGNFFDS
jgi:hypothetical protein